MLLTQPAFPTYQDTTVKHCRLSTQLETTRKATASSDNLPVALLMLLSCLALSTHQQTDNVGRSAFLDFVPNARGPLYNLLSLKTILPPYNIPDLKVLETLST